ncbi:hypothetical protein COCCU_01155 [Corynebacterium occultum]|uniref:Uncharacterized protein n=1 Tax=Corynebacterium occultum TaxID=2675219 RepID=A0A6B8VT41_9CORY|nr:hypothetical protein [Corynebacterium occultum]QGU06199.1 hypothetical protein COCCU_01155 [Corynebacterium occultum]
MSEILRHPVIAVVDKRESGEVVLWHVQTSPEGPAAAGALSGAWIFGEGELDPGQLADLLHDAVILEVAGSGPVAPAQSHTDLATIMAGMRAAADEVKEAAKAAKARNKTLQLPRLEAVSLPDPEELRASYHGEEVAAETWAHATAVAELVEQWHTLEAQRRARKYLQELFGTEVRPLPWDKPEAVA